MSEIKWDELLFSNYRVLEAGKPKVMTLRNGKPQEQFKDKDGTTKPGITLECEEEDGTTYVGDDVKVWTVTSIRCMKKLRPIIEKAEAAGKSSIKVSVVKVGEKMATQYDISEV